MLREKEEEDGRRYSKRGIVGYRSKRIRGMKEKTSGKKRKIKKEGDKKGGKRQQRKEVRGTGEEGRKGKMTERGMLDARREVEKVMGDGDGA